jgi:hypothetical protein
MKRKLAPSTPDTLTPFFELNYLKLLKAVPSNDKVGQTFVTTFNKPIAKDQGFLAKKKAKDAQKTKYK